MDNINMSEEQYKALYNRIKEDLYDEFINPETATFGMDVVKQKEQRDASIYKDIISEKEIIWDEIQSLKKVLQKYEETEEYELAAKLKIRIDNLIKKL